MSAAGPQNNDNGGEEQVVSAPRWTPGNNQNRTAMKRARSFAAPTTRPWFARLDPRGTFSDHQRRPLPEAKVPPVLPESSAPSTPPRVPQPPPSSFSRRNLLFQATRSLYNLPLKPSASSSSLDIPEPTAAAAAKECSSCKHVYVSDTLAKLLFCFCGLQISYLSWAYLQELIMTTPFEPTPLNPSGRFPSASFCVFLNRCVALTVALVMVRIRHGACFANNAAPVTVFVPCAISNTLSSISQYASLKYVSFPVMTVFKSSTIIPVMIMGYLIKGSTYPCARYAEAALITVGVAIFSMSSHAAATDDSTSDTPFGMMLLVAYVIFDSFTTQWQDYIYSVYGRDKVDPYQMMLGVDTTAILFTTISLLGSGELPAVWEFFGANPHVMLYSIMCPVMSACGQLCIFYTIKEFGPVVFTVIMTTRKLFSIGISSAVFGHEIRPHAALGGALVLGAIFHGAHRSCQQAKNNTKQEEAAAVSVEKKVNAAVGTPSKEARRGRQATIPREIHCDSTIVPTSTDTSASLPSVNDAGAV